MPDVEPVFPHCTVMLLTHGLTRAVGASRCNSACTVRPAEAQELHPHTTHWRHWRLSQIANFSCLWTGPGDAHDPTHALPYLMRSYGTHRQWPAWDYAHCSANIDVCQRSVCNMISQAVGAQLYQLHAAGAAAGTAGCHPPDTAQESLPLLCTGFTWSTAAL